MLSLQNLHTTLTPTATPLLSGLSLQLSQGETLGLLGESGCGKSLTAYSIMHLLPQNIHVTQGKITFMGQDITHNHTLMPTLRGKDMAMIFQDPMTTLNPTYTIGRQLTETLIRHQKISKKSATHEAQNLLQMVGISDSARRLRQYPHEFSGGMLQRVIIAMAVSCHPKLLIADEPTTALDVTIQAQILDILKYLRQKLGMALLLITHDMGVVAEMCQRVVVMYAGRGCEWGEMASIMASPAHPYTHGLLGAIPHTTGPIPHHLHTIQGAPPPPTYTPTGCPFAPRCPYAMKICTHKPPPPCSPTPQKTATCWLWVKAKERGGVPPFTQAEESNHGKNPPD